MAGLNFKQILKPAQVSDVEAAQRRQQLAEALQQRAMQGNPMPAGGAVQAKYGAGNALVDLANSLASSWNLKNANAAYGRAKEAKAADIAQASDRMSKAQPNMPLTAGQGEVMSPLTPEEGAQDLGRAMGPEAQSQVAMALMERKLAETDPNTIADRELKAAQIVGTLDERRQAREDRMAAIREQIAAREQAGQNAADLRRELAANQAALQRELAAGRSADARYRVNAAADAKADAATAKADEKQQAVEQGAQAADGLIAQLRDSYKQLNDAGDIVSTERGAIPNIMSRIQSSGVGQFVGGAVGTKSQSQRESIAQTRPLLLAAIKDATGMSARQLDSNAELKLWLSAATDPVLGFEANSRALDNIENFINAKSGKSMAAPATPQAPEGVSPELWEAMTPEERALWQN